MYDELIRALRETDFSGGCPCEAERLCKNKDCVILQAADAIEALEIRNAIYNANLDLANKLAETRKAIIDKIMNKQKWIPVTERLPLYGQDVLAVRAYGDGEKCQEVLMAHIAVRDEETGKKWWNATNITHWMSLPELPQEEI